MLGQKSAPMPADFTVRITEYGFARKSEANGVFALIGGARQPLPALQRFEIADGHHGRRFDGRIAEARKHKHQHSQRKDSDASHDLRSIDLFMLILFIIPSG
jgi:hypothetical protein